MLKDTAGRRASKKKSGPQTATDGRAGKNRVSVERLLARLFEPVDIASVVFFRVAFGLIMLWEVSRFFSNGWIPRYYIEPIYYFSYYGFGWLGPWPGIGMYLHFAALGILAVCITLGFFYRVATALFFVGFSYVFLLDQTNYLNHFYLVCLLSLILIFIPAHRYLSADVRRRPTLYSETVPAWAPGLLAALMGIAYFYGGLAKINGDWLRGEPMRDWLAGSTDFPLVGALFTEPWMAYLFSYGGLFLDLLIVPFLIWRRTRIAAFVLAVAFHLTNAELFSIGIFPWLAIALTAMFFPPSWPRQAARRLVRFLGSFASPPGGRRESTDAEREEPGHTEEALAPSGSATNGSATNGSATGGGRLSGDRRLTRRQWAAVGLLAVFVSVQLLVPLRHHLYPGNSSWTEEGHRFAWHMMLRSVSGEVTFNATNPDTGRQWQIDPEDHLAERQADVMAKYPDMILQFAHMTAQELEADGNRDVEVRADAVASLNGRDGQQLVDPEVDLAAQPRNLAPARWIAPLEEPLPPPQG